MCLNYSNYLRKTRRHQYVNHVIGVSGVVGAFWRVISLGLYSYVYWLELYARDTFNDG